MESMITCDLCLDHVTHIFCTYLSPKDAETIASCLSSGEMATGPTVGRQPKRGVPALWGLNVKGFQIQGHRGASGPLVQNVEAN